MTSMAEARGSRQEGRGKRKQVMAGLPVLFILGTTVPKAAIQQGLGNLFKSLMTQEDTSIHKDTSSLLMILINRHNLFLTPKKDFSPFLSTVSIHYK